MAPVMAKVAPVAERLARTEVMEDLEMEQVEHKQTVAQQED